MSDTVWKETKPLIWPYATIVGLFALAFLLLAIL